MDILNYVDDTTISYSRKSSKHAGPRKRRPKKKRKTKTVLPADPSAVKPASIRIHKTHSLTPTTKPPSYVATKKQLCVSAPSFSPQTSASLETPSLQAGGNDVEAASRAYWSKWAIEAAENERSRSWGYFHSEIHASCDEWKFWLQTTCCGS